MASSSSRTEILNAGGLRVDGRRPYELRSLSLLLSPSSASSSSSSGSTRSALPTGSTAPGQPTSSLIPIITPIASSSSSAPDGSATFQSGLTTCTTSIFGPREPKLRSNGRHDRGVLNVEVGVASWGQGAGRGRNRGDKRLLEIAASIRQTFEPIVQLSLYPRSEINIHVQVLGSDGGILPTSINSVTLALIDAGISMTDYVSSLSIGLHLTQPLLDLSSPEEQDVPFLVIACAPRTGKITMLGLETRIHVDRFEEMLVLGVEGCKVLHSEMEKCVRRRTRIVVERMKLGVVGGGSGAGAGRSGLVDEDHDMR